MPPALNDYLAAGFLTLIPQSLAAVTYCRPITHVAAPSPTGLQLTSKEDETTIFERSLRTDAQGHASIKRLERDGIFTLAVQPSGMDL